MANRCFVAGFPIAQSRSPLIHGRWIAGHGLDASYERLEVRPEELQGLVAKVRGGAFLGGNLTVPLKEAVIPYLDGLTPDAQAMGAVNTLFREDGKVIGDNTDVAGFFAHLDQTAPDWDAKPARVVLLGAGGAGRAIAYGALRRNVSCMTLVNRSRGRAELVAAHLRDARIEIADWPAAQALLASADLLINTTSLGMKGQTPLNVALPEDCSHLIADDVVYAPLVTPLLAAVKARGGTAVDGLGMLLHQASRAFERWFGLPAPVDPALRALIEADLAETA